MVSHHRTEKAADGWTAAIRVNTTRSAPSVSSARGFLPRKSVISLLILTLFAIQLRAQNIPSFPGALGFGNQTTGGWSLSGTDHIGGTVYHVTNLNDSGPGSFRSGVGGGGNIVVFDVGGMIQNLSPVSVSSNVSIEGQTAPGGIQIYGAETSFYGKSNIICRYVHFMDGTLDPNYPGTNGTQSSTNACNLGDSNNIIMDHCSFEFAAYNNIDSAGAVDITFQNCIFADPIKEQQFNCHFETGPVTFIGNLWANSHGRNPLGKANMQYVNNIVYDYGYAMTTGNSSGRFNWDVIDNYFISGPATTNAADCYYQVDGNQSAYAIGNYLDSNRNGILDGSPDNTVNNATVLTNYYFSNTASLPTLTAQSAFYTVISNAGPLPRNQADSEVVSQVLSLGSSGGLFTTQYDTNLNNDGYGTLIGGTGLPDSDDAGMPDDWKAAEGLSLTNASISGSTDVLTGYTYLEDYLAWKAKPNAFVAKNTTGTPTSVTVDLSQYANGFTAGSTFTISGTVNGTVSPMSGTQSGTSDFIMTFTPKLNTSGLGGFTWSVTNGITTMTSTCGVLISQYGPSQSIVWKGDGVTNAWNSTTANWTLLASGSTATFGAGDPVTFNDSGSTSPSVNLTAPLSPGLIQVQGTVSNYMLSGTGYLAGNAAIVKTSLGSLTIANSTSNTFAGGVVVDSGTLVLGQYVGTGPITLAGNSNLVINSGVGITGNILNVTGTGTVTAASATGFGAWTGGGTLNFAAQPGYVRYDLEGNTGPFTGTMDLGANVYLRFDGAYGSATAAFNLGAGPDQLYARNGNNATYSLGSLTATSTNAYLGGASDGVAMVWSIGGNNQSTTFPGTIAGPGMSITKVGTGVFTISGTNTGYTGTTNVNAGYLQVFAPQGNSNMTVNSGGTLICSTTLSGLLTLNAGGFIFPSTSTAPGAAGSIVTGSGLTVNGGAGATIYYNLSKSPAATGSNNQITVTGGNISLSGIINFEINMTNGQLGAGTYYLINGVGVPIGVSGLTLNTNIPGTNRQGIYIYRPASGTNPGYVALSVTGSAGALTWTGTNGATWDLDTTSSDWSGASPSTFYNLDSVTFNDSNPNGNVTLSGTLQPSEIYVTNNTTNYTLSGTSGVIAGNGGLIKSGSASLTISAVGTFYGPIDINGGTLYADAYLGSGTIYLSGGTLTVENGTYLGNPIVVETNSTINAINGSDWITNNVGATLTSTQPVTLNVVVANGSALTIPGAMDGFQGTFEMGNSGGLVRFDGDGSGSALFDIGSSTGWFANRNGGVTVNFGGLEGGPNTTLGGRQAGSGETSSTYVVGALNQNSTFSGTITTGGDLGGLNITKVGTGNWTLTGTSTFTGIVGIAAGTLTVSGSLNNNGLPFEAQSGAGLTLAGGTVSTEIVQIDAGALFTGNGVINGELLAQGTANVSGGGSLTVNGNFENDGTLTVSGSTTLVVNVPVDNSGSFVNNGTLMVDGGSVLVVNLPADGSGSFSNNKLLDIMDSPQSALPAGYINNGIILTSSLVTVNSVHLGGGSFSVTLQSYTGHTYQLEKSSNLTNWYTVGSPLGGTGSPLVLTDAGATSGSTFYKVGVGP